MKKLYFLDEEEKNRILNLHESATNRQYLSEQGFNINDPLGMNAITKNPIVQGPAGDPYQYMKWGDKFWYAKKNTGKNPNWTEIKTPKGIEAVKTKLYSGSPSTSKPKTTKTTVPDKSVVKPDNEATKPILNINIPLHHYAALRFLNFSKTTLTESEINQKTLNDISNVLCEKSARMKTCNPSQWSGNDPRGETNKNRLSYNDYTTLYSKSPSYGKKSFTFEEQPFSIKGPMLTFGQATITGGDGGWLVTDTYNFDNIQENKPYLKSDSYFTMAKNVVTGLFRAIKAKLNSESPVDGIEEAMSQLHNLGYNGYEVKIKVPSNGCKCKY